MRIAIIAVIALVAGLLALTQLRSVKPEGPQGNEDVVLELLKSVPDVDSTRTLVAINRYDLAASALGIEKPSRSGRASVSELSDYVFKLRTEGSLEDGPFISGFDADYSIALSVMDRNAGYDIRDIVGSVRAGLDVDRYEAVLLGTNSQSAEIAILNSQAWPVPARKEHQGVTMLGWGDDLEIIAGQRLNPPAFDQVGRGLKMAFNRNLIYGTFSTPMTQAMIDAALGTGSSLASSADYEQLAMGADVLKLYSMIFSTRTQSLENVLTHLRRITLNDEQLAELTENLSNERMLLPYRALGTGIGRDEDHFYMGLILVHESAEIAEQNRLKLIERLSGIGVTSWKKPWNKLLNAQDAQYELRENVLLAKFPLSTERASNLWVDWFYLQDPLLLHE